MKMKLVIMLCIILILLLFPVAACAKSEVVEESKGDIIIGILDDLSGPMAGTASAFVDGELDTLLDPTVIIEVLSESTEPRDRGWKAQHYQKLPSLHEYVFIAQDQVRLEHYIRQEAGMWLLWTCEELDGVLRLGSIQCEIPVADIYDKVELPASVSPEQVVEVADGADGE